MNGTCRLVEPTTATTSRLIDFLPLMVLPVLAFLFRTTLVPWVFMWAMALSLYAGCKWLTYRETRRRSSAQDRWRVLGYFLMWPGMNAAEFLGSRAILLKHPQGGERKNRRYGGMFVKPTQLEWVFAWAKAGFGMALLFAVAPGLMPLNSLAAGWTGMCGAMFILHFGLFHLLSLTWRRAGVRAEPIMQNPLLAGSLAEFWGQRWNAAFNELAFRFAYRPLRRRTTPAVATLGVFGLSGLIHELVISLPAGGGYGLPTAYFLIQGFGLVLERSSTGQRIGLARGLRGRIFAVAMTAGPAFWLFHPPFIRNVILPMLHAIGAT